jgi:16S rRNA G966 N2-methylase RsmD
VFVERAAPPLKALRANLARLEIRSGARIVAGTVAGFLHKPETGGRFDVVFLDPPYDAQEEYAAALELLGRTPAGVLADGAMVIAEHRRKDKLEDRYDALERTRLLQQGDAALSFYAMNNEAIRS